MLCVVGLPMITASRPWAARRRRPARWSERYCRILPRSITRAQAEEQCSWLQSSLDLSDAELKKVVL